MQDHLNNMKRRQVKMPKRQAAVGRLVSTIFLNRKGLLPISTISRYSSAARIKDENNDYDVARADSDNCRPNSSGVAESCATESLEYSTLTTVSM